MVGMTRGLQTPSAESALMEIQTIRRENAFVLELKGRFDANWSSHVAAAVDTAIQGGEHTIALDLQQVSYISSAGIGVLIRYFRQLTSVKGSFRVLNASGEVLTVLKLMKLTALLCDDRSPARPLTMGTGPQIHDDTGCRIEVHQLTSRQPLNCRVFGHPDQFAAGRFNLASAHSVRFDTSSCGLGLGAFSVGSSETDSETCGPSFGESLGVAGAVIQHATDGSRVPDFQIAAEDLVPELRMLYGMQWSGEFPNLLRFEAARRSGGSISLSELVSEILRLFEWKNAAFVFVAESTSLVGARLIQSPLGPKDSVPFEYPAVRDWLSFFSQPDREPRVALITGIAARQPQTELAPFLRPMADDDQFAGHFHAAVFHYSPLPKGVLNLQITVRDLMQGNVPQSVWHLLRDTGTLESAGETELMRGACWCGPISAITHLP